MRKKWFSFKGVAIYNHPEKKFWHRDRIKDLAVDMWNEIFDRKPKNNGELKDILVEEFCQFTDDNYKLEFWDDMGEDEMVDIPQHFGFGIYLGDTDRFNELASECIGVLR